MKKFWMMVMMAGLFSMSVAAYAQPAASGTGGKDDDTKMIGPAEQGAGLRKGLRNREKLTADQIIERIGKMKEKILGRIGERLEKLPERLEKLESRADRLAERRNKRVSEGVASGTADRSAQAKEKITKRYEEFKSRIAKRREQFEQRATQRREKFEQRIAHLSDADKAKVMSAFESTQKDITAEITKISAEVQKKLDDTFQKVLAKFN